MDVNSFATHGVMYWIQHYVIKFVSDLQQVGGFLRVLRFPPPIKPTTPNPLKSRLLVLYQVRIFKLALNMQVKFGITISFPKTTFCLQYTSRNSAVMHTPYIGHF